MTPDEMLTAVYQHIEARLTHLDNMSAPEYQYIDAMDELRTLLYYIDGLDYPDP